LGYFAGVAAIMSTPEVAEWLLVDPAATWKTFAGFWPDLLAREGAKQTRRFPGDSAAGFLQLI